MPTFREDLHLGHDVPLVETDDLLDGSVTHDKLADDAVGTGNIIDSAVTTPKLADGSVTTPKIATAAVTTPKIANGAVTPDKISSDFTSSVVDPIVDSLRTKHNADVRLLRAKDADLQNQIDSLVVGGHAMSNAFGDNPLIGVSQQALTAAINQIWAKLEDITGESLRGVRMTVTPDYYIGESGADVSVSASTADANGIFERIAFYINGELLAEAENVYDFTTTAELTETSVVRCEATILGVTYVEQQTVVHYSSFWLGAASAYADIMDVAHVIPITNGMRGAYDITAAAGDRIFVVVGDTLREGFVRADINGSEIPFSESAVVVDGNTYRVFTSDNTYQAGTYNIDING